MDEKINKDEELALTLARDFTNICNSKKASPALRLDVIATIISNIFLNLRIKHKLGEEDLSKTLDTIKHNTLLEFRLELNNQEKQKMN